MKPFNDFRRPPGRLFLYPNFCHNLGMPEMPEVETIRLGLKNKLIGQKIKSVVVRVPKLFVGEPYAIIGERVMEIERRSKVLIWKLSKHFLLIHLKMTGQLIYVPKKGHDLVVGGHPGKGYTLDLPHKYTHIIFELEKGTLYFNDLRKFGWVKVVNSIDEVKSHVAALGPEYDWPEFTLEYLTQKLAKRGRITIKQALLDQTILSGLGNIYADETLFCAKVRPTRKITGLKQTEIAAIYKCIPTILKLSLKHGGTSSQHYRQADGSFGTYLKVAKVYKREGLPCKICGQPIARIRIAGRSSHYCSFCQK